MKVTVAKSAGFCGGVKAAVDKALALAKQHGKVYTLGELVHNELVSSFLQSNGVYCLKIEDADRLKEGDVALIRAHGIPLELEADLRARGVDVEDATCPVVKKIHKIVEERYDAGDDIVIIGDKGHDEVIGSASRGHDRVTVFGENETPIIGENPTSIVFQTTILADKFAKLCDFALNLQKNSDKSVGIFDTICYTTKARQEEARTLARENDAVLVLGSRTSANTKRLFEVASEVNANVFFAESPEEALQKIGNKHLNTISIVAGASTPQWLIQEVTKLMSEIEFTDVAETAAKETEKTEEAISQPEAKATAEVAQKEEVLTMEDVMKSDKSAGFTVYKAGKRFKGTVLSADENGIFVRIGGKKDGFIDKEDAELDGNYNPANYKAGDEIEAIMTGENSKDYVMLSKKEVDVKRIEEAEAEKALAAGDFELTISEITKGGLRGRLGQYTVFVPASQIKKHYVQNLEEYKGKTLTVCLMPPKEEKEGEGAEEQVSEDKPARRSKYLFASARMVIEREEKEKEDAFWDSIHIHDIVKGKVKRFTTFGAFVSVNGFDCLAHISELSWNKINDPSTVLTIGESYDFVVLKMDRVTGKISLGYKQLQKKPYEAAAEKFPVGTVIKGKVARIFAYGAFIAIEDGIDGLVHVSQISHNWIKDAGEVLKVGQEVDAKIIGFEENRITLSIKELLPAPEEAPAEAKDADAVEADGEEKPKRSTSRVKKFEEKLEGAEKRGDRRPRRDASSNEPKEWVSGNSSASFGDLIKGLNLDLGEEEKAEEAPVAEAPVEEAPAPKKTTRKKKVEAPADAE